ALSSLRRVLEPAGHPAGPVLLADHFTVQLNPARATTDVAEFEALLDAAEKAASPGERIAALAAAVDLGTEPLLPGHYEEWVVREQARLGERLFQALGQLCELHLHEGDAEQACGFARRAVALDPLREAGCLRLMRCLAAA